MAGLLDFVLPAIFSAGNTAKRQISGLLGDPVGTVKQFINNKNDEAKAHLADVKLSTQGRMAGLLGEQVTPEQLAADQRWTQALANGYNPAGMIVWHGSPHNFTKFDASKIGTGEGAQAYGHGLYLAESPGVAKSYQKGLTERDFIRKVRDVYDEMDSPADAALALAKNRELSKEQRGLLTALRKDDNLGFDYPHQAVQAVLRSPSNFDISPRTQRALDNFGSLYKVDLPDEHIAKMLDWDKPLSQQAPEVQKALADEAQKYINRRAEVPDAGMIVRAMQPPERFGGSAAVSEMLRQQGIPGIRYLDGGSRAAGQGTANYVIFPGNEGLLTILERNGVPLR